MKQNASMLEVRNLRIAFGGLVAVKGLSLGIAQGSVAALVGPNGAGKTTVVNALTGFARATSGEVLLAGARLNGLPPHRIADAGIARTFQNIRLFGGMTVLETLATGAHVQLRSGFLDVLMGSRQSAVEERDVVMRAKTMMEIVGLPRACADRAATTLSYGMQRRVEIARALMGRPKLLLLDEPIAGMNVSEKQEIGDLVLQLKSEGMTILMIEHDMQVVRRLSDHVTVLHHGEAIADGGPDTVLNDERVKAAYLGRQAA